MLERPLTPKFAQRATIILDDEKRESRPNLVDLSKCQKLRLSSRSARQHPFLMTAPTPLTQSCFKNWPCDVTFWPDNLCCVRGCSAMSSRGNRKDQPDSARITAHGNPRKNREKQRLGWPPGLEQMSEITTVLPLRLTTPISDDGPNATYAIMFQKPATPIHCVLVYFPIVFVHCNPGLHHVDIPLSVMIDILWIQGRKEYRMSLFLDVFATWNQSSLNDRVRIGRAFQRGRCARRSRSVTTRCLAV